MQLYSYPPSSTKQGEREREDVCAFYSFSERKKEGYVVINTS